MIPEIPGALVTDAGEQRKLQDEIATVLQTRMPPRKFPGAQPISFARGHIRDLLSENYFVSEKADGVRVLMYTRLSSNKEESFLVFIL